MKDQNCEPTLQEDHAALCVCVWKQGESMVMSTDLKEPAGLLSIYNYISDIKDQTHNISHNSATHPPTTILSRFLDSLIIIKVFELIHFPRLYYVGIFLFIWLVPHNICSVLLFAHHLLLLWLQEYRYASSIVNKKSIIYYYVVFYYHRSLY